MQAATLAELCAMDRAAVRDVQLAKLNALLAEILPSNRFYSRKLGAAGITPGAPLARLEDLARLPFTTKDELLADQEANPPYGTNLTYPVERYARLHQSSGSKGRPLRWLDTPESWDWLMGLWRIIFEAAGITRRDRFFFPFSFGPFLGFWAGFEAAARSGCLTMPGGGMTTRARLQFLIDNAATVVCCTPTYALHLAGEAEAAGINLAGSAVRRLIVAGEPGGSIPEVKARIEAAWGARCIDHSGMTEIGSLGFEHVDRPGGLYLIETECIGEILNPETLKPAATGERGELVLTNLGRLGSPLIRYRTGDFVQPSTEPTGLARGLVFMGGGILGRSDDMVLIRGNNVYPAALEAVLRRLPEVGEYRAEVSSREGLAVLTLTVECAEGLQSNTEGLAGRVAGAVKDALNFRPEVHLAQPGELPRFELKASRFIIHASYRKEIA